MASPGEPPADESASVPPVPQESPTEPDVWVAPTGLRAPAHRVDPRARHVWRLAALLGWIGPVVAAALVYLLVGASRPISGWVLIAVGVLALVNIVVMPEWRYRVHRWEVDELAVYTQSGWWSQSARVAPLNRVQTVDSAFGPLQRAFGLGTLTVTTASAGGAVTIEGLPRARVEELVDRLTRITAADAGDAT